MDWNERGGLYEGSQMFSQQGWTRRLVFVCWKSGSSWKFLTSSSRAFSRVWRFDSFPIPFSPNSHHED